MNKKPIRKSLSPNEREILKEYAARLKMELAFKRKNPEQPLPVWGAYRSWEDLEADLERIVLILRKNPRHIVPSSEMVSCLHCASSPGRGRGGRTLPILKAIPTEAWCRCGGEYLIMVIPHSWREPWRVLFSCPQCGESVVNLLHPGAWP